MPKFSIPPKENFTAQTLASIAVLLIVVIVVAILGKLLVAGIIFLLGVIFGIGTQVVNTGPLDKEK